MERSNISVVLASYNGAKHIEKQIKSIIPQLIDGDEIIVSDDGSKDETCNIVSNLGSQDSRIKLIEGPKKGFNKNFENAIMQAKNEYVFICDQDDEWMPNKVEVVLNSFDDNTLCIRHDCKVVDGDGNVLIESYVEHRGANVNYKKNIYKNTFTGCCMCIKRDWLNKLLPFPDGVFYDAWIGVLSCKFKCAKIIPDKLINWCRHEGTVTKLNRNGLFWILKDRMRLYKQVRKKVKKL